ncbi:MAG: EF-P lysine aminoacylase EpmA [Thermodesulfobacteriota bacterium]
MSGLASPASPDRLWARAATLAAIRAFFTARGFLEVETPILLPTIIPERHLTPVAAGAGFLQASPEQCMKRLLARGYPRLFQIARAFRAGERGQRHLPELTLLEWYRAGAGYQDLMADCQDLLLAVAQTLGLGPRLPFAGRLLDLTPPWPRLTVEQAFRQLAGIGAGRAATAGTFDRLLCDRVEPWLGLDQPLFLHDYPAALASLARLRPDCPAVAERFELYAAGCELANGFSELGDPDEQRRRLLAEAEAWRQQGVDPGPLPERFLADLAAMPPAAGIALGVDRLVMLMTDAASIDQVVAFPPDAC